MDKKTVMKNIFDIGFPSFLETLFTTFASIIDSKMVSSIGVTAISAVSVTNQPRLFIFSVFFALNTVTSSLTAKYLGKGDREMANRVFDSIIKITVLLSVICSVLAVVFARPIMIFASNQKDTLDASIIYFRIVMGGMIFNMVFMAINSALRGCGKTKITFLTNMVSCVVNIFFNYLLIEGHLGFPRLEYAGAAIATVMGTVAAMLISIWFASKEELFVNIPYCIKKRFKKSKECLHEIDTLARSCITDSLAMRLSIFFIAAIVARIGSYQMAVYSVGMHLMNVNMALGMGFQTAGVALIGRKYGAEDKQGMHTYKNAIVKTSFILSLVLAVIIMAGGKWFYSFFSTDETFVSMGTISCLFIGVITLSQTLKFSFSGCLQGIGAMKQVMIASIVSFAGINLGMLVLLVVVFKIGIWGVWISTFTCQTVQAAMLYYFIKKSEAYNE